MEPYDECKEESSCVVLFYLSAIINNMTVDKMLGLFDGPVTEASILNSLRDYKVNQLPYCKMVSHILSIAIDSFSRDLMCKAESAGIVALAEKVITIV